MVVRDPLCTTERWPWPNLGADRLSLWQPIPVGLDEDGELVTLSLVERNILYGGEPGSGKSVAQSLGTATAALDPDVKLHLFDGKYVELAPWAGCAEHMIGPNQDEAIDVLKELVADMDGRYMQLLANKRRKLRPEDGLALHVVEIDELAFFCNGPDRAANKAFTELARDLVGPGSGGWRHRQGGHPEAIRRHHPDLPARPVRGPLGVPLLHLGCQRHHPGQGLGQGRLLGRLQRRRPPRRRLPAA